MILDHLRPPRTPRANLSALSALLVGGVLASAGCSEPISLSCPPGSGDVIVVDNRLQGRWSVEGRSPQLSEEWRRNLPEEFMAAAPEAVNVGPDGTVTVVNPRSLPGGLVTAVAEAELDERLPAPTISLLPSGDWVVALPPRRIEGGADERRVSFVVRMAPDGSITDTLYAVSVAVLNDHGYIEWPRPGTRMPLVAVGPGGVVALAGASSAYRIDVLRTNFTDSLVICRQAPALTLTESETGEVELPGSPPQLAWLLDASRKVKPPLPFGRIFMGSEGRLWVQRERPDPQRIYAHPSGAAYDVFEAGGEYLGEVRAPERVVLVSEAGGLVYGLEGSDDEQTYLVAFDLR